MATGIMSLLRHFQVNRSTQQTPNSGTQPTEVCIANISPAERRKRLNFAIISLVLSLIVLAIFMANDVDRWWRLPLFLLIASATTSYFQWTDKTCVALARQNSRKTGETMEKIEDLGELAQVHKQARQVQVKGLLAAIVLTLIVLVLPI